MALGLLLWISCFFLLFDGSAGLPAIKGYGYPYVADSSNIGDDGEDEVLTSPTFDQSDWQASNNQPTGPVYTSYNKPSVAQQPDWVPSQQNLPYKPSAPEVERLVNGESKDWGLENLNKPLSLPLSSNYQPNDPAKPQPGPVQPQSISLSVVSTNPMPASPSTGGSTLYATAYYEPAPSSTPQAVKSPSFESWQPEPVSSGYGVADFNTGSSAAGGDSSDIPHLVYEEVFQYPSENTWPSQSYGGVSNTAGGYGQAKDMSKGSSTGYASTLEEPSFPSYATNVGAQSVYPSGMGSPSSSFPGGVNQPRDEKISWRTQKPVVSTQKVDVSQRVSEPILPPPPPSSYIVQSRNGYQGARYLLAKSSDSPEFPPPMSVSSKGVKGPAPSQPAAPKGVPSKDQVVTNMDINVSK